MLLRATRKRSQPRGRAWMVEAAFRAAWEGPDPRPADSPPAGWVEGRPAIVEWPQQPFLGTLQVTPSQLPQAFP